MSTATPTPTPTPLDDAEAELVAEVLAALGSHRATAADAEAVVRAAEPLWDALGALGLSDGWGGGEFRSVFPDAVSMVRCMANLWCRCLGPQCDDCPDLVHEAEKALSHYRDFAKMLADAAPTRALIHELHELGLLSDEQRVEDTCALLAYPARLEMRGREDWPERAKQYDEARARYGVRRKR